MKLCALILILFASISCLTVSAQDVDHEPVQITPTSGSIVQAKLSPDGTHIAIMTIDPQGEPDIKVWNTTGTPNSKRLIPELTLFQDFVWSPDSQYLAVTGHRANGSGDEYTLTIYDALVDALGPNQLFRGRGRFFGEFVPSAEFDSHPEYAPVWSVDSRIIAVNFRDGIHFYDITDCTIDECNMLYVLEIGYVPSFDWQGDILTTSSGNTVQLWDVSEVSP